MEMFEKVEKLREHADVSYEEARDALEKCNGDLLDAMVYLERQGKAHAPKKSVHSTSYDQQEEYRPVQTAAQKKDKTDKPSVWNKIVAALKKLWDFLINNYFVVSKDGKNIIKLPALLLAVMLIFFWWWIIILLVVFLVIGYRYSFSGNNKFDGVNDVMDKAGDAVDKVKEDIKKNM